MRSPHRSYSILCSSQQTLRTRSHLVYVQTASFRTIFIEAESSELTYGLWVVNFQLVDVVREYTPLPDRCLILNGTSVLSYVTPTIALYDVLWR